MPQIEMVTYGDTALFSVFVFWVYFVSLVWLGVTVTALTSFSSFFKLTLVVPLARLYSVRF